LFALLSIVWYSILTLVPAFIDLLTEPNRWKTICTGRVYLWRYRNKGKSNGKGFEGNLQGQIETDLKKIFMNHIYIDGYFRKALTTLHWIHIYIVVVFCFVLFCFLFFFNYLWYF
jgi:hypothetical protein